MLITSTYGNKWWGYCGSCKQSGEQSWFTKRNFKVQPVTKIQNLSIETLRQGKKPTNSKTNTKTKFGKTSNKTCIIFFADIT